MLTEFEERVLAAASVARSGGLIQTYLSLLEVVRLIREDESTPHKLEHMQNEDSPQ